MLEPEQVRAARDAISDTLASIERGEYEASVAQQMYLMGMRDGLGAVLELEAEPPDEITPV